MVHPTSTAPDRKGTSSNSRQYESEEEASSWIPLNRDDDDDETNKNSNRRNASTPEKKEKKEQQGEASREESKPRAYSTTNPDATHKDDRLERLQTKLTLQSELIHNPMDFFWKRFSLNLFWEVYYHHPLLQCWQGRVGILCILSGLLLRVVLWSNAHWKYLYYSCSAPQLLGLVLLFGVSVIYLLTSSNTIRWIQNMVQNHPPEAWISQVVLRWEQQAAQSNDDPNTTSSSSTLHFLLGVGLIPTVLEVQTFLFLTEWIHSTIFQTESLLPWVGGVLILSMGAFFWVRGRSSSRYDDAPATTLSSVSLVTLHNQGLMVLYGVCFLWTMWSLYWSSSSEWHRIPWLLAPLLSATGTLLVRTPPPFSGRASNDDDDQNTITMSFHLRNSLRLTLRQVLTRLSEQVSQDELLRLAMLRWIVDYWATSTTTESSAAEGEAEYDTSGNFSTTPDSIPDPSRQSSGTTPPEETQGTSATSASGKASGGAAGSTSSSVPPKPWMMNNASVQQQRSKKPKTTFQYPQESIGWDHLLPMLKVATNQMISETQQLQQQEQESSFSHQQEDSGGADPLEDLRGILLSLNVDERGKPAVQAYEQAVASVPPPRHIASTWSMMRRAPAVLAIGWKLLLVISRCGRMRSTPASASGIALLFLDSVLVTALLTPFCFLEYQRICSWMLASTRLSTTMASVSLSDNETTSPSGTSAEGTRVGWQKQITPDILQDVDPMVLLLCGDSYEVNEQPPKLLMVWRNVQGSVSALRVGLTATRCIQTTAVAAQFAGNVQSLVELGFEVHKHGWLHGVAVLAKEVLVHRLADNDDCGSQERNATDDRSRRNRRKKNTKYTSAAMDAVQNAQTVAMGIHSLQDDEHIGHVVRPAVSTISAVTGFIGNAVSREKKNPKEKPGDKSDDSEASDNDRATSAEETPETDAVEIRSSAAEETTESTTRAPPSPHEGTFRSDDDGDLDTTEESVMSTMPGISLEDVMEIVASSHESGRLSSEQKNEFLTTLSALTDEERNNPAILKGFALSLQGFTDPPPDDPASAPPEDTTQQADSAEADPEKPDSSLADGKASSSKLMELVLTAYYKGAIDKAEKEAFCDNISAMSDKERGDPNVIGGMIRTLEAMVEGDFERVETGGDPQQSSVEDTSTQSKDGPLETKDDIAASKDQQKSLPSEDLLPVYSNEETTQKDDKKEWMKLGMVTLGSMLSGIAEAGKKEKQRSAAGREEDRNKRASTVVQVEETHVEDDDEWIAVDS